MILSYATISSVTSLIDLAARGCTFAKAADPTKGARDSVTLFEAQDIARQDPSLVLVRGADLFAVLDGDTFDGVREPADTIAELHYGPAGSAWAREMATRYGAAFVGAESGAAIGDRVVIDEDGNASIV